MSPGEGTRWGVTVDSPTEERNLATVDLDVVDTLELLTLINAEDRLVPDAVAASLPDLARLVDGATERVRAGGTVHYVGAGTSGRLGVVDAAELLPTFHLEEGVVTAHLAGGPPAIVRAAENVEDDRAAGADAVADVREHDVVVGLAASGRTPYVAGALAHARERGALTALVTSNPRARLLDDVDVPIVLETGPEALTGSTRMKSATAQKLVLHSFSTALMVRLGRTWSNLMVSMVATNEKLRARTVTILTQATGLGRPACEAALEEADGDLKVALVMILAGTDPIAARTALTAADGVVRTAVQSLPAPTPSSPSRREP
ncbi:N-acetylmuramic acid 6-phosphate etherase [Georgenia satyanarayanai]|uniref:N-acetylmuramic acid 6-phosphate etherase n=1 Tax=Georgenia satyanarayanai TaxID=860221 RepID=UPI00126466AF|nr:N-acetylmuramic acid 6-phosphate etherase [Georgenia satyanarayanai]